MPIFRDCCKAMISKLCVQWFHWACEHMLITGVTTCVYILCGDFDQCALIFRFHESG